MYLVKRFFGKNTERACELQTFLGSQLKVRQTKVGARISSCREHLR